MAAATPSQGGTGADPRRVSQRLPLDYARMLTDLMDWTGDARATVVREAIALLHAVKAEERAGRRIVWYPAEDARA